MKNIIYLFVVSVLLTSCKNVEQNYEEEQIAQFDSLTEQTLEVHDDVMAEMGTLMDLSLAIDEQLKSEGIGADTTSKLTEVKTELDNTHDAMMDWMKEYSTKFPYEAESPSSIKALNEKMPILEGSYEKIKEIQEQTDKVIADAEQLLTKTA
jgi:PBP1b-binding outer membrane lipoprotein LpoB